MKSEKGFSILEVGVVLAIVGILSGIVALIYKEYKFKSYSTQALQIGTDLRKSIEAQNADRSSGTFFEEDREFKIEADGLRTCSLGCSGLDLSTLFPGFSHNKGTHLEVTISQGGDYEILSGHCYVVSEDQSEYLGWRISSDGSVVPRNFPAGSEVAQCKDILAG